jgi:hypothetical protein
MRLSYHHTTASLQCNNNPMFSRIARCFKKETKPIYNNDNHHPSGNMTSNSPTTMFRGLTVIPSETCTTNTPRKISKSFLTIEVEEGAGMGVRRGTGLSRPPNLSPFITLDHFISTFGNAKDAGAPDHPRRVRW